VPKASGDRSSGTFGNNIAMCECLQSLDDALKNAGFKETFRGRAWGLNCREWAYFDVLLSMPEIRKRFDLPQHVRDHKHLGTHDGAEAGFVCELHDDAIMGVHPSMARGGTRSYTPTGR